MSRILAIADLLFHDWTITVTFDDKNVYSSVLEIGFTIDRKLPVSFSNLSFNYEVYDLDTHEKIKSDAYPQGTTRYIGTDQVSIVGITLTHLPEKNYKLILSATNNNHTWTHEQMFTIPRPTAPFNSWIWDDTTRIWKAPIPYPMDPNNRYTWNEEKLEWVILS